MGKDDANFCAALSYVVIGIIWYFADKKMRKNPFATYHAKQGIVLLITTLILSAISSFPIIGWYIIGPITHILVLIWVIIGAMNGITGKKKPLFWIGGFAKKLSI